MKATPGGAHKTPLRYQASEYDCGPTTLVNALSYLFDREDIPPEVVRCVYLYCLDAYNEKGEFARNGTSCMAMLFMSSWLDAYGQVKPFPVRCRYCKGEEVYIGQESRLVQALFCGGVVIVRLLLENWHYVLLTGIDRDTGDVSLFDPYFTDEYLGKEGIRQVEGEPCRRNRVVPAACFNREHGLLYSLGPVEKREAVLLFNRRTEATAEQSIEYFI